MYACLPACRFPQSGPLILRKCIYIYIRVYLCVDSYSQANNLAYACVCLLCSCSYITLIKVNGWGLRGQTTHDDTICVAVCCNNVYQFALCREDPCAFADVCQIVSFPRTRWLLGYIHKYMDIRFLHSIVEFQGFSEIKCKKNIFIYSICPYTKYKAFRRSSARRIYSYIVYVHILEIQVFPEITCKKNMFIYSICPYTRHPRLFYDQGLSSILILQGWIYSL